MDFSALLTTVTEWMTATGIKVVIALVVLFVSFRIIKILTKKINGKIQANGNLDKTVSKALVLAINILLKCLIGVCIVGYLGIDTSTITALITSIGVTFGLAINGTISNFAGGVMIIITRPFKDDDYISACGQEGYVTDIHITYTEILTLDNKVVHLPNGTLSSTTIVNYTEKDKRRVDLTFSISYSEDYRKAERIILDVASRNQYILNDPAPEARIIAHQDSSIDIISRSWVKTENYWNAYFDMLEGVKSAFDSNGIEIPFNQLDVHVKNN